MDFLKHTTTWVEGEVLHGKVMTALGIIILICCFFIWRSGNEILKGMLIPVSLVVLILMGYGIFQITSRPSHLMIMTTSYQENPKEAIEKEKARVFKDKNAYTKFKIAWAMLILVALIFFFMTSSSYYRGLALGVLFLGTSTMIVDTVMQQRSADYYKGIESIE